MMNLIMNLVDAYLVIGVAVAVVYSYITVKYSNDVCERNEGESGRCGTLKMLFHAVAIVVLWPWLMKIYCSLIMPRIANKYGQSIYEDVENGEFESEKEGD